MLDIIEKIIGQTPLDQYKYGVAAKFYPINDKWGMKFFVDDEDLRDKTHKMQKLAAKHGLAPKIGKKFSMRLPDSPDTAYGYITEILPATCSDEWAKQHGYDHINKMMREYYYLYKQGINNFLEFHFDDVTDLEHALEEIGISATDMHWSNVGYLNGNLVAIDFSQEDFMSIDE